MQPIRWTCKPRPEVLKGDLQDAIFAAEFRYVLNGTAPAVYQQAEVFFRNTHPAAPMKKIVRTIFERLADPKEAGAAIRLSTGFGGGKTHTLIALYHLARNVSQAKLGTELLPAAGRPDRVAVAGIDAAEFGSLTCGHHDDVTTHSLWGELAYALQGKGGELPPAAGSSAAPKKYGYALMADVDDPHTLPNADTVRSMFPDGPVLILLDELVIYMTALDERGKSVLLSFLNMLIAEVGARPQTVLVITDPASQAAYAQEAQQLADELAKLQAAQRLDDVLSRKVSDFDPIGNESAQVINRRLFESIETGAADEASAEYFNLYKRVSIDYPDVLPPDATVKEYAAKLRETYPFHPRLVDTARNRLGSLPDFQKSRGTLRLFARLLRDLYESQSDVALLNAGDVNWGSPRIQDELLDRLHRTQFEPAVDADWQRHAGQLDAEYETDMHRRVASAILLESLPMTATAGLDRTETALAVLRPSDVGPEAGEAADRLLSVCWYTYKDDGGRRFQFRIEANVNRLIEERSAEPHFLADARQYVTTHAHNYFKGQTFTLVAYPTSPKAVADSANLKLVLSEKEELAQAICDFEDNSDPAAPRRRPFRNAIIAIAPTREALLEAEQHAKRLLAAEAIYEEERKKRDARQKSLMYEQLDQQILPTLRKRARFRTLRAFNRILFSGRPSVSLDEKYLVSEDNALSPNVPGQQQLKKLLDEKDYIYQINQALDVDLLIDILMKGATPAVGHPGAFLASAIHERALSSEKLRLLQNEMPVRKAILNAVADGRAVVRMANGDTYDRDGCVFGPSGARQRGEGQRLSTLALTSDVLVAPANAACVADWTRTDEQGDGEYLNLTDAAIEKFTNASVIKEAVDAGLLDAMQVDGKLVIARNERYAVWEPTVAPKPVVYTWNEAIERAAQRPLRKLRLSASTPAAAKKLLLLAQPFGAQQLRLNVSVSGKVKDGGAVNFSATGLKHNHALKPIDLAAQFFQALDGEQSTFASDLNLDFGERGMSDAADKFSQAQASVGDQSIDLEAEFGEVTE